MNDAVSWAVPVPLRKICLDIVLVHVDSRDADVLTYALLMWIRDLPYLFVSSVLIEKLACLVMHMWIKQVWRR